VCGVDTGDLLPWRYEMHVHMPTTLSNITAQLLHSIRNMHLSGFASRQN